MASFCVLLIVAHACAHAQGRDWDLRTSYLRVQGRLVEPEEVVVRSYLQRRLEITGVAPHVRICDRLAEGVRNTGFWKALVAKGYAATVVGAADCPESPNRMPATGDTAAVWLLRGVFTRDSSLLEAYAGKSPGHREGTYVPAHGERFFWNHRLDVGGHELKFFGFRATDS